MKSIQKYLFFFLLFAFGTAKSQSSFVLLDSAGTTVVTGDTLMYYEPASVSSPGAANYFTIKNNAAQPRQVLLRWENITPLPGTAHLLDFSGLWYTGQTDTALHAVMLQPQAVLPFHDNFISSGNAGTCAYRYCVYDSLNPADQACFVVKFVSVFTAVPEIQTDAIRVFPNPVTGAQPLTIMLPAPADAVFVFTDIAGKTVKTVVTGNPATTHTVSLHDLPAGIYYYTVFYEGEKITTQKLVVVK